MARLLSRVVAVAFVALFGAGAPVHAQSYSWDGFYIGSTLGFAWSAPNTSLSVSCPANGYLCTPGVPPPLVNPTWSLLSAFNWSGQFGYNWQYRSVVLGAEVDGGYLNLRGSPQLKGSTTATGAFNFAESLNTDWIVLVRGRVGWAVEAPILFYFTAGGAFTDLTISNSYADVKGIGESASASSTVGWTVGAGAELALTHAWTVKADYAYVDFGSNSITGTVVSSGKVNGLTTTVNLNASIFRAGVNFRFNPP